MFRSLLNVKTLHFKKRIQTLQFNGVLFNNSNSSPIQKYSGTSYDSIYYSQNLLKIVSGLSLIL